LNAGAAPVTVDVSDQHMVIMSSHRVVGFVTDESRSSESARIISTYHAGSESRAPGRPAPPGAALSHKSPRVGPGRGDAIMCHDQDMPMVGPGPADSANRRTVRRDRLRRRIP
jgi:hypothetical protein